MAHQAHLKLRIPHPLWQLTKRNTVQLSKTSAVTRQGLEAARPLLAQQFDGNLLTDFLIERGKKLVPGTRFSEFWRRRWNSGIDRKNDVPG